MPRGMWKTVNEELKALEQITKPEQLRQFLDSEHEGVRRSALSHKFFADHGNMIFALESFYPSVRQRVLRNPAIDHRHITVAIGSKYSDVRELAVEHEHTDNLLHQLPYDISKEFARKEIVEPLMQITRALCEQYRKEHDPKVRAIMRARAGQMYDVLDKVMKKVSPDAAMGYKEGEQLQSMHRKLAELLKGR